MPAIAFETRNVRCIHNPLGVKSVSRRPSTLRTKGALKKLRAID
jgi:hypothetical protein